MNNKRWSYFYLQYAIANFSLMWSLGNIAENTFSWSYNEWALFSTIQPFLSHCADLLLLSIIPLNLSSVSHIAVYDHDIETGLMFANSQRWGGDGPQIIFLSIVGKDIVHMLWIKLRPVFQIHSWGQKLILWTAWSSLLHPSDWCGHVVHTYICF